MGEAGAIAGEGGRCSGESSGDRAVVAVGAEGDLGHREGVAHSMRPLYLTAATAIAALAVNAVFAGN